MHGREGEEEDGKRRRHMWPVHARGNTPHEHKSAPTAAAASVAANGAANSNPPDHFLKDGRKICVGDCALFQSGNSPPFIGIIRWFTKGDYLKLGVNWLYRPSDIKLAKGASFEAAPNEIFYSFHRDEISAESLLHPCKVAFLRKGVELPQGISSFVCRRVYDIANKCLWWLTDQDYIKERQEEVDRLLDKTQLEMHAALQSGGRSPKPLNGPNSPQHLKSASESIQNSGSTTTQVKGKKREKIEQSLDSAKRDRTSKMDDGDSSNLSMIKSELARITEKGGLTDGEGVEKLLQLMQHDKVERKLDSVAKVLLADVIANTDRYDCLQRFVQLKGVIVFDDWLQEAHKSKSGDSSSPKESDKSLDELLLALLRALQKLPVNLHALQTSNIGKSVNNLRSQKNHDIQKKARNLVDTWKKRVDAEIKLNDSKSVASGQAMSWSVKQTLPDNSHGILKRSGSSDGAIKSSLSQSSSFKSLPAKPANGDPFVKSAPAFSGLSKAISPVNISVANSKETHAKTTSAIGASEVQLPSVKEDGSSGSNNSQNNCQSHSGEHARNPSASWKDESKCSASSLNFSKTSGVSSRHRKSSNGFAGAVTAGVHKEASLVKASLGRNTLSDKVSQSGLTSERVPEGSGDSGNNQRLIVRLPNPGRNQVQSGAGSSFEEPSVAGSRASSPVIQDKHDQNEHIERLKEDSHEGDSVMDATTDSPHNQNDNRGSTKPEEGKILFPGEDENRRDGGNCKEQDAIKGAHSLLSNEKGPLSNEIQSGNARKPTNSMNALIESCVKQSESSCVKQSEAGNTPGDDVGMNLLASVAAGEMLKPDSASPAASPVKGSTLSDHAAPETKSRLSCENGATQGSNKNEDGYEKPSSTAMLVKDELLQSGTVAVGSASVDVKSACIGRENVVDGEQQEKSVKLEGKTDEAILCHGKHAPTSYEKVEASEVEKSNQFRGKRKASGGPNDNLVNGKRAKSPPKESKPADIASSKLADGSTLRSEISCIHSGDGDGSLVGKVQEKGELTEQTAPLESDVHIEKPDAMNDDSLVKVESSVDVGSHQACNNTSIATTPVTGSTAAVEEINATDSEKYIDASSVQLETSESLLRMGQTDFHSPSVSGVEPTKGDHSSAASTSCQEPTQTALTQETEHGAKCEGQESPKTSGQAGGALDDTSLSKASGQDTGVKCIFDLNEGISNDEANPEDHSMQAAFSSQVAHPGVLPFMVPTPIPTASVPITVAAPAKRPFVPPENLLKSKGEVGWKGSAATSAFRPAEPRKVLEMPLSVSETSSDTLTTKQSRPQFDFDLNVADERVLQDIVPQTSDQGVGGSVSNTHTQGKSVEGLDLDLNRVDEGTDFGLVSASTSRSEVLSLEVRPPPGIRSNGEATASRGIDLNDGPGLDDAAAEPVSKNQQAKSGAAASLIPPIGGPRLNNAELGNLSSWFPPGNSYSTVTIPQFLPSDRGDHSYPFVAAVGAQRYLGTGAGGVPLGSDSYRAPVLPSPAMSFNPYPTFPFASSFPIASTSFSAGATTYVDSSTGGGPVFPPVASQLAGPANPISSAYLRPVLISHPDSSASSSVSTSSQRWGRQSLDLNAGPGIADTAEGREEKLISMRQQFVAGSQLSVEDQARLFQVVTSGGGLKRKDPEGGWEMFPYNKQQSRQ